MFLFIIPVLIVSALYWLFTRERISSYRKGKQLRKPAKNLTDDDCKYELKNLSIPRVTGLKFKLFMKFLFTRFGRKVVVPQLMKKSGLFVLDGVWLPESPTFAPLVDHEPVMEESSCEEEVEKLLKRSATYPQLTIADYTQGYQSGHFTPTQVITATIKSVEKFDPILKSISQLDQQSVMKMASSSTRRWQEGKPLSVLDGVPAVIKEELNVKPYVTYTGCKFVPACLEGIGGSTVSLKLKEAGAIVLGVTSMQEMGFGTMGSNPNRGMSRNPYNTDHYAGGSSTGSAIAVAAGFCPISIGCDGGGSIRIPSALCGIVGLKPTFARVSSYGCTPTAFSVSHIGPMCSTVADTAILYSVIAGRDEKCPVGLQQPTPSLSDVSNLLLDGITIGVYSEWFEDAETSIVLACKNVLKSLESLGASVVEIKIPELEEIRACHVVTIASELCATMAVDFDKHFDDYNLETLAAASGGYGTSGTQYFTSQKQRTRSIDILKNIFQKVDCIITPAAGMVAPIIPADAMENGQIDAATSGTLMKFSALANFTGIPGVVVPVGYDEDDLPIGLQVMGRWWEEHVILRVAHAVESVVEYKPPKVYCNPLENI